MFIFVRIIYLKQKKEETLYDYRPASNFQGFDFLTSYVYLLCILFFQVKIKEEEEEEGRRTGKKMRLRVYKLCIIYFPTRR